MLLKFGISNNRIFPCSCQSCNKNFLLLLFIDKYDNDLKLAVLTKGIIMIKETHYMSAEGKRIATADHHRNRGTCCKSGCLHCPYGTTIERFGLVFHNLEGEKLEQAQAILAKKDKGVAQMLLQQAFGNRRNFPHITKDNAAQFRLFDLKGYYAGIAQIEDEKVKRIHLLPYFDDQGITLEVVDFQFSKSIQRN